MIIILLIMRFTTLLSLMKNHTIKEIKERKQLNEK